MKTLGFTGMPWSGKSEAVHIAIEKNIPVFHMGDHVWNEVRKRGLSVNAESVGMVAHEMRQQYGPTIWAKKTYDAIKNMPNTSLVVIDGIRSIDEVEYFRSHLSNSFYLIAITAPDHLRHARAKKRKRADDSSNEIDINKRDLREKKWGIEKVINSSDISINNDSSLENFQRKIHNLFSELSVSESID